MSNDSETIATTFAALLSLLAKILSLDQLWELEVHADHDEHEVAFSLLCSILRRAAAPIPEPAWALLVEVGGRLGAKPALWRRLPRARND